MFGGTSKPYIVVRPALQVSFWAAVGAEQTKSIVIENHGDAPLTITKAFLSLEDGGDFSMSPITNTDIEAGGTLRLQIKFKSNDEAKDAGQLTIQSNDEENAPNGELYVTLTGVNKFTGQSPVADPGSSSDYSDAKVNQLVTLDGSKSQAGSSGGNEWPVISYFWVLADKPTGSKVFLQSSNKVKATFTPDVAGDYLVCLTVYADSTQDLNDYITSDESCVTITVGN
jgi:hypothetical protein